jgi:predicted acylesterase/phospholipase RssA
MFHSRLVSTNASRLVPLGMLLTALMLSGCGRAVTRSPVPANFSESASIPGFHAIRFWGDRNDPSLFNDLTQIMRQYPAGDNPQDPAGPGWGGLVLSGGGDNGAFGAGILCGWTSHGDRPKFRIVTGVSTGALIAPFAFLGSEYDPQLKTAYTTISASDVLRKRKVLDWFSGDSIADSKPLQEYSAELVTDEMIRQIAVEHRKGRRLYVQTVNLDAQRPVVWDMGAIACSDNPDAPRLFRQIMVASAAIPGVFPPQYISVEANGRKYDEMHVDGGTVSQMLLSTLPVDLEKFFDTARGQAPAATRRPRIYVIRNGRVGAEWQDTPPRLVAIAGRAISTMIKAQSMAELNLMYQTTRNAGIDFLLCYIPDDYVRQARSEFDTVEMNRMFMLGHDLARSGNPWREAPPRFE